MRNQMTAGLLLAGMALIVASQATAGQWGERRREVRREVREGAREVARERREMRRGILEADTPWERRQAVREGAREIMRERREARREVRREVYERW
jgi:hypothetical protein